MSEQWQPVILSRGHGVYRRKETTMAIGRKIRVKEGTPPINVIKQHIESKGHAPDRMFQIHPQDREKYWPNVPRILWMCEEELISD